MDNFLKKIIILILLIVTASAHAEENLVDLTLQEKQWIKSHPVITLGSDSDWIPYIIENLDGTISGYDKDILDLINKHTGANFQLVAGKWKDMVEKAVNHEIDGLSTSAVHEERRKNFNFSDIYVSTQRFLAVSETNPKKIFSIEDLAGKKIGYQDKNLFDKRLVSKFTNSDLVPLDSLEDVLKNLITGKIDATISSYALIYLANKKGFPYLKIVDYVPNSRLNLVFSIRKDYPEAISILNKGLKAIASQKIAIDNKWFFSIEESKLNKSQIKLTRDESNWLKKKPYLSVMSLKNFQPFNFRTNDKPMGYSIEVMKIIGKMLNKDIKFIKKPWNEQVEMLKSGELDISPHIAVTEERKKFVDYTNFIHLTFMVGFAIHKNYNISSMKDFEGKTIAVVKGYYLHNYLEKNFPNIKLLLVNSTGDAIQAVAEKKAFAVIDNIPTLNYFIYEKWLGNLKIDNVNDLGLPLENKIPMGVAKGNKHLKSILEKAYAAIPAKDIALLRQAWMLGVQKSNLELSIEEKEYLENKKRIKMCIDPDWMPFEANIDGKHAGMTADYFKLIESKIGIPIEMVPTDSWVESLEKGKNRECDIFSLAMETPERRQYLNFTSPYLKSPLILATSFHEPWAFNIMELEGKKIGIVAGYAYGEILKNKYPKLDLVYVKNIHDGLRKVETGEVFGFIGALASVGYHIQREYFGEIKISGKFNENWDLGIGVRNDEPLLHSILNKAINEITPKDHQIIRNKWLVVDIADKNITELTDIEEDFIKAHPVIRFCIRPNMPPFGFVQNGKPAGIAVDYISAISEQMGFQAVFIENNMAFEESYKVIEGDRKEFDTFVFSVRTDDKEKKFAYGNTYLSYPMMIIGHKDSSYIGKTSDLKHKKVVVEKGIFTYHWLKKNYPEIIIVPAKTTKEALQLVSNEDVDAYMGNIAIVNYLITHENMSNLKVLAPSDYGSIEYSFIAPKEWPELISILNKGYRSLPSDFHTQTLQKWFSVQIIHKVNYTLLWKVIIAVIFIILWILWWNRKLFAQKKKTEKALQQLQQVQVLLKNQNEELEQLSVTDRLTSLYNRLKLDSVLADEFERSKRYENKFGVIMADIDHFKSVNDTYGHQTGDYVLVKFADLIKSNVRKVDIAGRWGGEEFLIICPETDESGLMTVTEKLRKIIEQYEFNDVGNITASFGAALYTNNETIGSLISRADEALYSSKKNGRNRVTLK